MAKYATQPVQTPIGDLEWVIISGEGKENLNGDMQYQASVVLDPEQVDEKTSDSKAAEAKAFIEGIQEFWTANKPTGYKSAKPDTSGLYPHTLPTGEKDEDGNNVYEETGKFVLRTKTGTTYPDGSNKVIKIFNAKGSEVSIGEKKIANESRGRIGCVMAIYATQKGKAIANAGVTFYLNTLQLSKFVEYAGAGFEAIDDEDEEDAFEGVGDMGGISDDDASTNTASASKPRLD